MINKKIYDQLESIYKTKREIDSLNQNRRFKQACEDETFKELYSKMRVLQNKVAKYKAFKFSLDGLDLELKEAEDNYNKYIKENNIDIDMHYHCDKCKDTGFVDNKQCSCYQKELITLLRSNCNVSPMPEFTFKDNHISKLNVKQKESMASIFKAMKSFCNNFDDSPLKTILLQGSVGAGKTFLASCMANDLLNKSKQVIYLTAFDFSRIIQAKQFNSDNTLSSIYPSLFSCDFLIIDDLGTEPIYKNFSLEHFLAVIDYRTSHNLKTMICTNLKSETFIQRYGERVFSRLNAKPEGFSYFIDGDDLRKIKEK